MSVEIELLPDFDLVRDVRTVSPAVGVLEADHGGHTAFIGGMAQTLTYPQLVVQPLSRDSGGALSSDTGAQLWGYGAVLAEGGSSPVKVERMAEFVDEPAGGVLEVEPLSLVDEE